MSYEIKRMSTEEARPHIPDYEYALIYLISEIILTKTDCISEINWEECTEARFFSEEKELHFFRRDGQMQAVEVRDKDEKDEIVKNSLIDMLHDKGYSNINISKSNIPLRY